MALNGNFLKFKEKKLVVATHNNGKLTEIKNLLKDIEKHIVIFDKGTPRSRKDKIIKYENNQPLLCWNYYRVSQENTDEVKQMCEKFQNFWQIKIIAGGLTQGIILERGEAVFFHDDLVLHGRNAFYGDRLLLKGGLTLSA